MDRMARSCGVDIPEAEGEPHAHAGILQNAGGSVKPCGAVCATGKNSGNIKMDGIQNSEFEIPKNPNFGHLTFARLEIARSCYSPDAATIVKRIVPIRLISLTCSPTWISTLYRPGFHASCGGESVR
jgi:hypothetical protein